MKLAVTMIALALLSTIARGADITLEWATPKPLRFENYELIKIGDATVTLRPLPPEKKNDPPQLGIFVNETRAVATPIYPGKLYHFAFVTTRGRTQWYINGIVAGDPTEPALEGELVLNHLAGRSSTPRALSSKELLDKVKASLKQAAVTTVGHRGVHLHAPENTRISYVEAVDAKTPIVEFDTALTSDGHIVGLHDKTVDRTTDGSGKVAELTLEQIRKLDAGSWKNPKYKGEKVPTLDEVADVCRGKAILMLDLKAEGQGKAIADWLAASKYPPQELILAPWEDAEGVALRKYVKDVPMIRLTSKIPTETIDDAYFAGMKEKGFSGFSVNWQYLNKTFIDAARKNGMKVYTWTLNEPIDITGAVLNGVDGIITDDPAATMKLISELSAK